MFRTKCNRRIAFVGASAHKTKLAATMHNVLLFCCFETDQHCFFTHVQQTGGIGRWGLGALHGARGGRKP